MHSHPGAEMLYVLKGHARVLGPTGVAPEKLDEGMAIFIPPAMPHAIENMGRHVAGGAAGGVRAARARSRSTAIRRTRRGARRSR